MSACMMRPTCVPKYITSDSMVKHIASHPVKRHHAPVLVLTTPQRRSPDAPPGQVTNSAPSPPNWSHLHIVHGRLFFAMTSFIHIGWMGAEIALNSSVEMSFTRAWLIGTMPSTVAIRTCLLYTSDAADERSSVDL